MPLFNIVLVSFLSMVVAIIIIRQTQELKQLEECMIENRLIRKTKQGISWTMHQKKWNYIRQQYTQVTKSTIIINEWCNNYCETLFLMSNEGIKWLLLSETILDIKGSNLIRFNEDQQSLLCTKCLQNEQEEWQIVKTSNRTNRIVQRQSSYSWINDHRWIWFILD